MQTKLKFAKVRPSAKIPSKRPEDAGYDIYADFELVSMKIEPHQTVSVPTGIACACEPDYCILVRERSSNGSVGVAVRSGVIDSGYRGEIFIFLTNTTNTPMLITKMQSGKIQKTDGMNIIKLPYDKAIAQLLVVPVPTVEIEECSYAELSAIPSERGTGLKGSSGK